MKNVILVIVSIGVISCSTILDINIPARPPKLTLNAIFNPDSLWSASLTVDHDILDSREFFDPVNDAVVVVYQDNISVDTLRLRMRDPHFSTNLPNYYSASEKPVNSRPYEIRAIARKYGTVSATSAIPDSTTIHDVTGQIHAQSGEATITLTFKDRENEHNYYFAGIKEKYAYYNHVSKDTIKGEAFVTVSTNDPAFQPNHGGDRGILFGDGLFDGKEISLTLTLHYFYPKQGEEIKICLRTISADLYNYLVSSDLQTQTKDDPFAQPALVFSNINNGAGIFAGYIETIYRFKF